MNLEKYLNKATGRIIGSLTGKGAIFGLLAVLGMQNPLSVSAQTFVQPVAIGWGIDWGQDGFSPLPSPPGPPLPFVDALSTGGDIDVRHVDYPFYYPGIGLINGLETRGMIEFDPADVDTAAGGWTASSKAILRVWHSSPAGYTNLADSLDQGRFLVNTYYENYGASGTPIVEANDYAQLPEGAMDFIGGTLGSGWIEIDITNLVDDAMIDYLSGAISHFGIRFQFEGLSPWEIVLEHLYLGNYADSQPQLIIQ